MSLRSVCTLSALLLMAVAPLRAAVVSDLFVTDGYVADTKGKLEHKGPATVSFTLDQAANVTVRIFADASYDPALVRELAIGQKEKGPVVVTWDGLDEKGQPIRDDHRVFAAEVRTNAAPGTPSPTPDQRFMVLWSDPLVMDPPKGGANLTVVPGADRLLQVGDEPVPFALQVFNSSAKDATYAVAGSVIGPDGKELVKIDGALAAPAMSLCARTFSLVQQRNGISVGKFTAAPPNLPPLTAETTFGRVDPRPHRFEPHSPFASVWVSGCKLADAIGIKFSRQNDVNWTLIQKQEGQPYDWGDPAERGSTQDGFMVDREKNHMSMLSILGYGEDWLGGSFTGCTIFNYDRFVNDYCVEVANHLKNHHSLLQFWNEPNNFWHVPMDQFYLVQRRVFSRIKTMDKNAFIMADGFAGAHENDAFMDRWAALGYAPYLSALTVHYPEPTAPPGSPEGRADTKVNNLVHLFELRDKSFPALEVWNTEDGLWGVPEYQKDPVATARDLPKIYVTHIAAGVERLFWFSLVGDNMAYLLRPDGQISEPAIAYASMTKALEGATFMAYNNSPVKGVREYAFIRGGKLIIVAWSNAGPTFEAGPTEPGADLQVLDVYGNITRVAPVGGQASLQVTDSPVYLLGRPQEWLVSMLHTTRGPLVTPAPLLTDPPALMADIRRAAVTAGIPDQVITTFETAWNDDVSRLETWFHPVKTAQNRGTGPQPDVIISQMIDASTPVRRAFEAACARKDLIPSAVTGLYKLDCLLEKAAEVRGIWPPQTPVSQAAQTAADHALQALSDANDALSRSEGDEYKPAARAYLSQLTKLLEKGASDVNWGAPGALEARKRIVEAAVKSIPAIAAGEPSAVISCVVNVYVNAVSKADRYMKLFDRDAVPGLSFPVEVDIDNYSAKARTGKLTLTLPAGWKSEPASAQVALKPGDLAAATMFKVTVPASAAAKQSQTIGAVFEGADVKTSQAFPATVRTVPAIEVTGLVVDNPAKPGSLVPRIVSHIDAPDLHVSVTPPAGVELATNDFASAGVKPGSIRNPHFPLVKYAPGQEYSFKVKATAGDWSDEKEFTVRLAGDGTPAPDSLAAWEKALPNNDTCDFSKGWGSWLDSGSGASIAIENGEFVGRTSRREFIHFARSPEVGPDFTLEYDVYLGGRGIGCNGAPLAMGTREKRPNSTAFRAMMINTYAHDAFLMDETWMPVGEKVPYGGQSLNEWSPEQWIHMKLASKGDELWMFVNDWPVYHLHEPTLKDRWLAFENGYANDMHVDNVVVKW